MPFWSPESRSLGFFAEGQLKIVGLSGGDPQSLAPALGETCHVAAGRGKPGGGSQPQWRADGKELFYVARNNQLIAIDIDTTGPRPVYGPPRPLFDTDITALDRGSYGAQYVVFKDGQRFLLHRRSDEAVPITVVLNWQARE